jgi:hypothetical protein
MPITVYSWPGKNSVIWICFIKENTRRCVRRGAHARERAAARARERRCRHARLVLARAQRAARLGDHDGGRGERSFRGPLTPGGSCLRSPCRRIRNARTLRAPFPLVSGRFAARESAPRLERSAVHTRARGGTHTRLGGGARPAVTVTRRTTSGRAWPSTWSCSARRREGEGEWGGKRGGGRVDREREDGSEGGSERERGSCASASTSFIRHGCVHTGRCPTPTPRIVRTGHTTSISPLHDSTGVEVIYFGLTNIMIASSLAISIQLKS